MILQMKIISSTTEQCRTYQEEDETAQQRLEPCVPIFKYIGALVKTQVKNGLSKLFNLRGHNFDVSYQAVFTLEDSDLHDEQGKKINASDPLTATQRRSGRFSSFMVTVYKHSLMTCGYK